MSWASWKRGVLAAPGGGGHQRRQSNDTADGIEGPDVNIWPSPSGFVPLLGGAAGLLHGGDVELWVDRVIFSLVESLLFVNNVLPTYYPYNICT